ncbi:MAG TPA: 6-phosphogluconolactonase, partial [Chromatiales bacterium]|nr:6-phosphogluconolactonase [Chromatiales bacterium]
LRRRGRFRIVLSGGTTPRTIYRSLREGETDWTGWHVYFGDERCLPAGDPGRNDHMAREAWLDHVPVPGAQIHSIPAERGSEAGARAYGELLDAVDVFDLVLLGLGEDGHTASLFPGHPPGAEPEAPAVLAVHDAPKPPPERISLSARRLSASRRVWFLVSGAGKADALAAWQRGDDIPARYVCPPAGVDIYTDIHR